MGTMTHEGLKWLRENYSKMGRAECAKVLNVHKSTIAKYAKKMNLMEKAESVEVSQTKPIKGYCLDCQHYMSGGNCSKTGRSTGALNERICFKEKTQ